MKRVLLFLAEGFEEVEAATPIDFLRRAGIEVTTVGIGGGTITGAHGVRIEADTELSLVGRPGGLQPEYCDCLVFPGGMPGAANIAAEEEILKLIDSFNEKGKIIGAICASPGIILAKTAVLDGKKATCYPGIEAEFGASTTAVDQRVVIDGNIITSRGPGTSAEFSIALIRTLAGAEAAETVKNQTLQAF